MGRKWGLKEAPKKEPVALAAVVRAAVLIAVGVGLIKNADVELLVAGAVLLVETASAFLVRRKVTPVE